MSAPNPQVSVFHFSSKISKAKIRKYKLATERGMAPDLALVDQSKSSGKRSNGNPANAAVGIEPKSHSPSMGSPPAKKPRLTLHVRPPPSESPSDTIAVSQPKRAPIKYRFQHDIFINSGKEDHQKSVASPSLSPPISVRSSSPEKDAEPHSARDDYGDFMSYYIAGGDDEEAAKEPTKPARRTKSLPAKQPSPKVNHTRPPSPKPAPAQPSTNSRRKSEPQKAASKATAAHAAAPRTLQHHRSAPPQPVLPQPTIHFIDITPRPKPSRPDTIAEMINKLQKLSRALTDFGGIPAVPVTTPEEKPKPQASKASDEVDDFLAQFEAAPEGRDLDLPLGNPGEPDEALSYGIQFIQNALRSWAQQRLSQEVMQNLHLQQQQAAQRQHQQMAATQRLGRPHKHKEHEHPPEISLLQGPIQLNMADTAEGAAIVAFQDVLDSGCLQVNSVLPTELTQALRYLYMQIDHLINHGSKTQAPWACMSYQSQITAHKIRVDRWKEAQAKIHEEMARQQQIAQQQMMIQMGLHGNPPPPPFPLNHTQAQHANAIELERRRSLQHAVQQPYISQQHLNPLQLSAQHAGASSGHPHFSPAGDVSPHVSFQEGASRGEMENVQLGTNGQAFTAMSDVPPGMVRGSVGQVQLDRMKLYMPGFLPRSGQSMKFSFAPHNEDALRVFGPQAFPAAPGKSNIPNRGPMNMPAPPNALPGETSSAVKASITSQQALASPSVSSAPPASQSEPATSESTVTEHRRNRTESSANITSKSKATKSTASAFTAINTPACAATPEPTQLDDPNSPTDEDTIHVAIKPPSRMPTSSATPAPDGE